MAIKMRNNKDMDSVCCNCGDTRRDTLEMFDLCIGKTIVTFCDVCNEQILDKTLKAECNKNARVKSAEDMRVLRKRSARGYHFKYVEQRERERAAAAVDGGKDE